MSIAIALILSVEAAASCAAGSSHLGGGAVLVRPVGTFEAAPFLELGPTTSIVTRPDAVQQVAADEAPETEAGPEDQPAEQCAAADWPIA